MKSLSKVFPIFALTGLLMLAGCASDELPSNGSGPGTTVPPIGTTTESGTVKFTNNTAMTIGSSQEMAMTRGKTFDFDGNDGCILNFDEVQPTLAEIKEDAGGAVEGYTQNFSQFTQQSMAVGKNGIFILRNESTVNPNTVVIDKNYTVYVLEGGTAEINFPDREGLPTLKCTGGGKIIVLAGGTLNINSDVEISDLTILNYGGKINIKKKLTINNDATLKTDTDLNITDNGSLDVQGKLYVSGSLNCETSLIMGNNTDNTENSAQIHVIGDFNYSGAQPLTITDPADICVEGKMSVTNDMTVNCEANIHADCSLEVTGTLKLAKGAILCATHIDATATDLTNDDTQAKIYLTSGAVAELGDLTLGNNVLFNPYGDTKALIDCNELTLPSDDISGIIGNSFYLTYEELTGSYTTESDITFADNSLINVAAVNENSTDDCNPGYSLTDIIIPLPDDIVSGFGSYILDADDFSIRINGDYIEDITVEGNTASLDGIVVTDNNTLNITLSGIKDENIEEGNDYTYEVYIWIRNVNPTPEAGTGAYLPLFGTEDYMRWIGMTDEEIAKAELPLSPDVNTGVDVTNEDIQASNLKVQSPAGYFVRYNIHRGLQGKIDSTTGLGDTPYIKVSIHIQKDPTMPANSAILIYSSDKKE